MLRNLEKCLREKVSPILVPSFPMDLDVRMKATLIGAMFLIDFMFFEKAQNEEQDGVGMF